MDIDLNVWCLAFLNVFYFNLCIVCMFVIGEFVNVFHISLTLQCVSQTLGTGKFKYINKEEALLQKDIEQADFDMLLANLRMDAVFVKENMRIRWASETGVIENIQTIVKEYKETRGLNVSAQRLKEN